MARISDLVLKGDRPMVQVFFWDDDRHLHCSHVNTAWDAIQASGFKIPYMCSYAVRAGAATAAIIRGLEHYRQTRCTHVGVLDSA